VTTNVMGSNRALPITRAPTLSRWSFRDTSSLGRIRSGRTFLRGTRGADRQTRPISQVLGAARLGTVPADRAASHP
jgi:hypothetical protein